MPLKQSEAIVLLTYPLREADLLVTLFTRLEGKIKGVAKSAKRSRKRFGGALEPLTCVRAYWQDRAGSDLSRLESCDVLLSPLSAPMDYPRLVALTHIAEMLDELLPGGEPNDGIFRLAWAVLQSLESGPIWLPIAYFDLWMLRLMGFLPPLDQCIECAAPLAGQPAFFHALCDGLTCSAHRRIASSEMSVESRSLAALIFRNPVGRIASEPTPTSRLADLRKFLMQILHRHLDRHLQTAAQLDRLD
ncbi:MAG: DNA repair protein RecO [Candidatus Korobacteraceae bacterium]